MKIIKEINRDNAIESGGGLWEKENVSRVYFNDAAIEKLFGFKKVDGRAKWKDEFKTIGKCKVWLDCKDNSMHSSEGRFRVLFNINGINCKA